jgi:hypothetical protein
LTKFTHAALDLPATQAMIAWQGDELVLLFLRFSIQKSMEVIEFIGKNWFLWRWHEGKYHGLLHANNKNS